MLDDVVSDFGVDQRKAVIALTHEPKLDDLALLESLESDAFYIGAIGSHSSILALRARMIGHFEQTEECLTRLRSPIGLYIGREMASEIAVSIIAEVLAVKNGTVEPRSMQVGPAKALLDITVNDPGPQFCGVTHSLTLFK
jgi:xanthine dehydrogenase accessory factor